MPTANPKISAYVPQDLYDRFIDFKEQRGLSSASQAAIVILTEFFGCSTPSKPLSSSPGVSLESFQELSQRVDELSKLVESITNQSTQIPQQESPAKQLPLLPQDSNTGIESDALQKDSPSNLPSELPTDQPTTNFTRGLSGRSLAARLACNRSTFTRQKDLPTFPFWSKNLDPENISWIYDSEKKKFFPESELL